MRSVGASVAPRDSKYDALTLANDVRALAARLNLERPLIVGHDMGGIVAYTFGRAFPDDARGIMLIENPLPGIAPWDQIVADPKVWHINFHLTERVPELLISGREADYFRMQFFDVGLSDPRAVDDRKLRRYACAYGTPERLRAGLGQYRAAAADAVFDRSRVTATTLPMILVGGEKALGPSMRMMAVDLRTKGWSSVIVEDIAGGSHYLLDEAPDRIAALIEQYGAPTGVSRMSTARRRSAPRRRRGRARSRGQDRYPRRVLGRNHTGFEPATFQLGNKSTVH